MSKYEKLINKAIDCEIKAIEFLKNDNFNLSTFFKNASEGYKIKANNLTVKEAKGEE